MVHKVPYVQGMMGSTVGLFLSGFEEKEVLQVLLRIFLDLHFVKFCRDGLELLSNLSKEAVEIVKERNQYQLLYYIGDKDIEQSLQMLGFKLSMTLFADYVGLAEVGKCDSSTLPLLRHSSRMGTRPSCQG